MADFTIFRTPIWCPGAHASGSDKRAVSVGDLVLYRESYADGSEGRRLARVLGRARGRLPDGSDPGKDTLVVLAVDEMMAFAYERYVSVADVVRVRAPSKSAFARWFLSGPVPRPEVAIAAVKYGCVNDRYVDDHLEGGELRATFRNAKVRKAAV